MDGDDIAQGLQYPDTANLKSLLSWIAGLQEVNPGFLEGKGKRDGGYSLVLGFDIVINRDH